jgi:Bacterial PH domain
MMLSVRPLGPRITQSASHLDVRYRPRPNRFFLAQALLFGVSAAYSGDYVVVGIAWSVVLAILLVGCFVLRLTADSTGVRIVNWGADARISWAEVSDVETAPTLSGSTVQFRLNSGRKIKVTALWDASRAESDRVVDRLRRLQRHAARTLR